MWLSNSSIGRKVVMSVTGIALVLWRCFRRKVITQCVNSWVLTGMLCWVR